MNIKPLSDHILIEPVKEDEKSKAEIVKLKVDSRKVLMESGMSEQNANIVTGIKID
jgi:co-chaperonin GroES (HSP10)